MSEHQKFYMERLAGGSGTVGEHEGDGQNQDSISCWGNRWGSQRADHSWWFWRPTPLLILLDCKTSRFQYLYWPHYWYCSLSHCISIFCEAVSFLSLVRAFLQPVKKINKCNNVYFIKFEQYIVTKMSGIKRPCFSHKGHYVWFYHCQ